MSRSGYTDDCENLGLWRGAVERAIRGKRGQQALKEIATAMDAMPNKVLVAHELVTPTGQYCTLGVLGAARGLDLSDTDPEDYDIVAETFKLAPSMVREIVYENDEAMATWRYVDVEICGPVRPYYPEYGNHIVRTLVDIPEGELGPMRWKRMREWVARNLLNERSN
ncbi:hypothetical protein [Cupriavidus sp. 2SB]|uniref:hypothetical protein n=1 Tax=Cupriavidus sp. 2SB TaxID=2502199 RepID=UPI0010F68F63|nr:hypothetical protein [Cupriavidus sp. 2SB]